MGDHRVIVESETSISEYQFWEAVRIFVLRPHIINRRLGGSMGLLAFTSKRSAGDVLDRLQKATKRVDDISLDVDGCMSVLQEAGEECGEDNRVDVANLSAMLTPKHWINSDAKVLVIMKKLAPKKGQMFCSCIDLNVLDFSKNRAAICPLITASMAGLKIPTVASLFFLSLTQDGQAQITSPIDSDLHGSALWLEKHFFPKFFKWADNSIEVAHAGKTKKMRTFQNNKTGKPEGSLNLVPVDSYFELYNKLKSKYGTDMIKKWPERTDPQKFIFEDIAIATYLLVLWQEEREATGSHKLQSFVDVGCGNGLLVYILSEEGHKGVGLDIRSRKVWSLYPETTCLQVITLDPSNESFCFPDCDWVIGNHSDELTPWVPLLAARSSFRTCFFLLPCCAHDFVGRYQRTTTSVSTYHEYMVYVRVVAQECGFVTEDDQLRIPSTKRTCVVGRKRTYSEKEYEERREHLSNVETLSWQAKVRLWGKLKGPCSGQLTHGNSDKGPECTLLVPKFEPFRPRSPVEKARNCTQLERSLVDEIVALTIDTLLALLKDESKVNTVTDSEGNPWNCGGRIHLNELATFIPADKKARLKKEFGGLKTLIRNHPNIFQVVEEHVQLRVPKPIKDKPTHFKRRLCWHFTSHPQGCPLSAEECNFAHGDDDICGA